jgi:hypothetical protein
LENVKFSSPTLTFLFVRKIKHICSDSSEFEHRCNLTKYMQHRNFFVREPRTNTKISDCDIKDKPWCTSCGPRAGVLLHPLTSIHASNASYPGLLKLTVGHKALVHKSGSPSPSAPAYQSPHCPLCRRMAKSCSSKFSRTVNRLPCLPLNINTKRGATSSMTSRAAVGVECMLPVMLTQARHCSCAVFRLTLICDAFFHHSMERRSKWVSPHNLRFVFPIALRHYQKAMVAFCTSCDQYGCSSLVFHLG